MSIMTAPLLTGSQGAGLSKDSIFCLDLGEPLPIHCTGLDNIQYSIAWLNIRIFRRFICVFLLCICDGEGKCFISRSGGRSSLCLLNLVLVSLFTLSETYVQCRQAWLMAATLPEVWLMGLCRIKMEVGQSGAHFSVRFTLQQKCTSEEFIPCQLLLFYSPSSFLDLETSYFGSMSQMITVKQMSQ